MHIAVNKEQLLKGGGGLHQRAKSQTRAHTRIKERQQDISHDRMNIVEPFVGEYVNKYGDPGSFVPSSLANGELDNSANQSALAQKRSHIKRKRRAVMKNFLKTTQTSPENLAYAM